MLQKTEFQIQVFQFYKILSRHLSFINSIRYLKKFKKEKNSSSKMIFSSVFNDQATIQGHSQVKKIWCKHRHPTSKLFQFESTHDQAERNIYNHIIFDTTQDNCHLQAAQYEIYKGQSFQVKSNENFSLIGITGSRNSMQLRPKTETVV